MCHLCSWYVQHRIGCHLVAYLHLLPCRLLQPGPGRDRLHPLRDGHVRDRRRHELRQPVPGLRLGHLLDRPGLRRAGHLRLLPNRHLRDRHSRAVLPRLPQLQHGRLLGRNRPLRLPALLCRPVRHGHRHQCVHPVLGWLLLVRPGPPDPVPGPVQPGVLLPDSGRHHQRALPHLHGGIRLHRHWPQRA